jgi:hypothetical protein
MQVFVGNEPPERHMCRQESVIELGLETDKHGVDWIYLSQDREKWQEAVVSTVMNFHISVSEGNLLSR